MAKLNEFIENVRKKHEQIIDTVNLDELEFAGWEKQSKEKAEKTISDFKTFIEENKDEIKAPLHLLQPAVQSKRRHI